MEIPEVRTRIRVRHCTDALQIQREADNRYGDRNNKGHEGGEESELLPSGRIGVEELIRRLIRDVWRLLSVRVLLDLDVASGAAQLLVVLVVHHR